MNNEPDQLYIGLSITGINDDRMVQQVFSKKPLDKRAQYQNQGNCWAFLRKGGKVKASKRNI